MGKKFWKEIAKHPHLVYAVNEIESIDRRRARRGGGGVRTEETISAAKPQASVMVAKEPKHNWKDNLVAETTWRRRHISNIRQQGCVSASYFSI